MSVKAPNFFRFGGDGAQWMAGLGTYAYKTLGWKKVGDPRRGLLVPVHAGGRVRGRVLRPRRPGHQARVGAADHDRLVVVRGPAPARRRRRGLPHRRHEHRQRAEGLHAAGQQITGHALSGSSVLDPTASTVGSRLSGLVGGSVPLGGTQSDWTSY